MTSDDHNQPLIGPGAPDDDHSMLIEDARERLRREDEQNTEGKKLARRLFVAFALVLVLGIVFYIVLPRYGVRMPAILPILCFGAILIAALARGIDENRNRDDDLDPPISGSF